MKFYMWWWGSFSGLSVHDYWNCGVGARTNFGLFFLLRRGNVAKPPHGQFWEVSLHSERHLIHHGHPLAGGANPPVWSKLRVIVVLARVTISCGGSSETAGALFWADWLSPYERLFCGEGFSFNLKPPLSGSWIIDEMKQWVLCCGTFGNDVLPLFYTQSRIQNLGYNFIYRMTADKSCSGQ